MTDPVYLTPEGAEELKQELDILLTVKRPELARKLKEAVAMGDLKENADYHDAKEQQAFIEGRIQYLENLLRAAVLIESTGGSEVVQIGSTVTIVEQGMSEEEVYTIVGAAEANPSEGKLSNVSPIGAALIGTKKGDTIRVNAPGGIIVFKVKKVR